MASILRVNTLTDASSGNSTAMSTINQGTAKCWFLFQGDGTAAIDDSFNASSLDDDGTGQYGINYTNNFSTTNQCAAGDSTNGNAGGTMRCLNFHTTNTTSVEMDAWAISTGAAANSDAQDDKGLVLGDLA